MESSIVFCKMEEVSACSWNDENDQLGGKFGDVGERGVELLGSSLYIYLFIYLTALGLNCITQDLCCFM